MVLEFATEDEVTTLLVQFLLHFSKNEQMEKLNMNLDVDMDLTQGDELILRTALAALERATRSKVRHCRVAAARQGDFGIDAKVELEIQGERVSYLVEVVQRLHQSKLSMLIERLQRATASTGVPGMIVAVCMSYEQANLCRDHQMAFIDTVGNVFITTKQYEVFIVGQRTSADIQKQIAPKKTIGSTGYFKAVFPLLCDHKLINAPYRELSRLAGVSIGTISSAFEALKSRNIVGDKHGERVWIDPSRLFQEWVVGYALKLRPKMNSKRYMSASDALWRTITDLPDGLQWGGEVVAERTASGLSAEIGSLFFDPIRGKAELRKLMAKHRFKADPNGNVEVLEAFWPYEEFFNASMQSPKDLTPYVVAYAELMAANSA